MKKRKVPDELKKGVKSGGAKEKECSGGGVRLRTEEMYELVVRSQP